MSGLDREAARSVLDTWVEWEGHAEVEARQLLDQLEECVRPFAWQDLENLLAEHYPEDIFPVRADDPSVDPGPRILALARLLHRAEAKLTAIEALITTPDANGVTRWRIGHARKRILAILHGPSGNCGPTSDAQEERP